jgi:hypothetical protein
VLLHHNNTIPPQKFCLYNAVERVCLGWRCHFYRCRRGRNNDWLLCRTVRPRTSAQYCLYVEATRKNLKMPDLPGVRRCSTWTTKQIPVWSYAWCELPRSILKMTTEFTTHVMEGNSQFFFKNVFWDIHHGFVYNDVSF